MTTQENPTPEPHRDALLLEIADRHLFLETLQTRNSDRLDFHEHGVWAIRSALEAAFQAGCRARADAPTQS